MKTKHQIIATLFFLVLSSQLYAQRDKLASYTASNGIEYSIGDEIVLGQGSDTDGRFVYVNIGGWAVSSNPEANRLAAINAGLTVTIKKIFRYKSKRFNGLVEFVVGGGNITNYTINIDQAIKVCEVEPCIDNENTTNSSMSKYDKLRELKELLDDGIITRQEFESEKEKVMSGN